MKIGILTQPLHTNYGGLLQCFALQTTLKWLGHEVWVVRRTSKTPGVYFVLKHYIKQFIKVFLGRKFILLPPKQKLQYIRKHTTYFVNKYIFPKSDLIVSTRGLIKYHKKERFDAYIVGSDQVWRPQYSPCITNYFLDFLSLNDKVKRISYAASFGVDDWEFTAEETDKCARLLSYFDAVSVRELSALNLCKLALHYKDVHHVLDPTMLLEKEDYMKIVEAENEPKSLGNLFCYILDMEADKDNVIQSISLQTGLCPFIQMPKKYATTENLKNHLDECVFPPVTAWLRAFMDAEMVVTDSFHGCVFSIIFNKPFWVIGNPSRGMARFHSLLAIYGLERRMITKNKLTINFKDPIDWSIVNDKRKQLKQYSLEFLTNALKK